MNDQTENPYGIDSESPNYEDEGENYFRNTEDLTIIKFFPYDPYGDHTLLVNILYTFDELFDPTRLDLYEKNSSAYATISLKNQEEAEKFKEFISTNSIGEIDIPSTPPTATTQKARAKLHAYVRITFRYYLNFEGAKLLTHEEYLQNLEVVTNLLKETIKIGTQNILKEVTKANSKITFPTSEALMEDISIDVNMNLQLGGIVVKNFEYVTYFMSQMSSKYANIFPYPKSISSDKMITKLYFKINEKVNPKLFLPQLFTKRLSASTNHFCLAAALLRRRDNSPRRDGFIFFKADSSIVEELLQAQHQHNNSTSNRKTIFDTFHFEEAKTSAPKKKESKEEKKAKAIISAQANAKYTKELQKMANSKPNATKTKAPFKPPEIIRTIHKPTSTPSNKDTWGNPIPTYPATNTPNNTYPQPQNSYSSWGAPNTNTNNATWIFENTTPNNTTHGWGVQASNIQTMGTGNSTTNTSDWASSEPTASRNTFVPQPPMDLTTSEPNTDNNTTESGSHTKKRSPTTPSKTQTRSNSKRNKAN